MQRTVINIFRSGKHTTAAGNVIEFTPAEMAKSAKAYDPKLHRAPLVLGHPKHNAPALGWVEAVAFTEPKYNAEADKVDPALKALVKSGKYGPVSASFYSPDSPTNPVPGTWYLRHVGFLGAFPPSVKGLDPVEFAEGEAGIVEFVDWSPQDIATTFRSLRDWILAKFGIEDADKAVPSYTVDSLSAQATREMDQQIAANPLFTEATTTTTSVDAPPPPEETMSKEMEAKQKDLEAREAKLALDQAANDKRAADLAADEAKKNRAGVAEFVESLSKEGRVLPRDVAPLVEVLVGIAPSATVEFSEPGANASVQKPTAEFLKAFLKSLPQQVDFAERAAGGGGDVFLNDAAAIASRAAQYQAEQEKLGNFVRASDAVAHVTKR